MHKSKLAASSSIAGRMISARPRVSGAQRSECGSASSPGGRELYQRLEDSQHDLHIEVQKVEHPSRVHLDIETDDIQAEVRRLEALGAKPNSGGTNLVCHGGSDRAAFFAWCARAPQSFRAAANGPERAPGGRTVRHRHNIAIYLT